VAERQTDGAERRPVEVVRRMPTSSGRSATDDGGPRQQ